VTSRADLPRVTRPRSSAVASRIDDQLQRTVQGSRCHALAAVAALGVALAHQSLLVATPGTSPARRRSAVVALWNQVQQQPPNPAPLCLAHSSANASQVWPVNALILNSPLAPSSNVAARRPKQHRTAAE
jgi:hypothetical protein